MRIVIRSLTFLPKVGGLENMMHQLALAWARQGHTVTVMTVVPEEAEAQPYAVLRNPPESRVRQLLREADLYVEANISLKTFLTGLRFRHKWVVSHQLAYLSHHWKGFAKRLLTLFAYNICCSAYVAQTLPGKSVVIPNSYQPIFTKTNAGERPYDFIFAGRMVSDKGLDVLVSAFLQYHQSRPESRLLLVGDGPERAIQQARVAAAGMGDAVTWAGVLRGEALVAAYNSAKIAVIPSRWPEPFGIVALEALACGCAVVASNGGGLPEAVGSFGYYFKNGNIEELIMAMKQAVAGYPQFQDKFDAIQTYLQQHTPEAIANAYLVQCKQWNIFN